MLVGCGDLGEIEVGEVGGENFEDEVLNVAEGGGGEGESGISV